MGNWRHVLWGNQRRIVAVCIATFIVVFVNHYFLRVRETVSYKNKIVALGDSLTAGLYNKNKFHPYTGHLTRLLARNNTDIEVVNAGISGERVQTIKKRLVMILEKLPKVQLVIILAGTNDYKDLIRGRNMPGNASTELYEKKADEIFEEIKSVHVLCFRENIRTVTVSIPELKWEENEHSKYKIYRENINEKLKKFAENAIARYTTFFDLASEVRLISMDPLQKSFFWDDAVHYTAYGYDTIAKLLYKHINDHVKIT